MTEGNYIELGALWVHLLAMVGAFGALFVAQNALSPGSGDLARRAFSCFNRLIVVGFLAGLALYYLRVSAALQAGFALGAHRHGTIGVKLLLLLAAGAFAGIGAKKVGAGQTMAARSLNFAALLALALATLLGLSLRFH